jgi:hypothetical protein
MLRIPHCLENRLANSGKVVIFTHWPHSTLSKDSLLLSFWTLSIVRISTNRKHNVSETGSVSVFRRAGEKNQKLAFPQVMPEQKKVNHWKQGDYKHLTAGRVHGM